MDTVSVIMPLYNNAATVAAALDSVVSQTYSYLEIIVIDDCSDDGGYAFAKAYSLKKNAPTIKIYVLQTNVNSGAGIARNLGIETSTGTYIAFLDADDLWMPDKLDIQLKAMKAHGSTVAYGAYEIFTSDPAKPIATQRVFEKLTLKKLLKANYVGHLTGIYNAAVLGKFYMPALRKRQDWALWLDVIKAAGFATGIQQPIASYRKGSGLSANKLDLVKYNHAIYRKHLKYSFLKSVCMLLQFFYEQFFVKSRMIDKTP